AFPWTPAMGMDDVGIARYRLLSLFMRADMDHARSGNAGAGPADHRHLMIAPDELLRQPLDYPLRPAIFERRQARVAHQYDFEMVQYPEYFLLSGPSGGSDYLGRRFYKCRIHPVNNSVNASKARR